MKTWFAAAALAFTALIGAERAEADEAQSADVEDLLSALDLPVEAHALRRAGAAEADVSETVEVLRDRLGGREGEGAAHRAARARAVLQAEREAASEHGPTQGLGELVRERLDDDVRGRELAEEIREHRERRQPAERGQDRAEDARDRASAGDEARAEGSERAGQGQDRADEAAGAGDEDRADSGEDRGRSADDARPEERARDRADGAGEARADQDPDQDQDQDQDQGQERGESAASRDAGPARGSGTRP